VDNVLCLARTGLIFTSIQEGAQQGWLTPPGQAEPGIPYHVPSCWVLMGGELGRGNSLVAREFAAVVWESSSVGCAICVFSLSVSSLFLFPLFAVLLNCPYPDPPVSACFFPFSSALWRGEGWPRGAFVASRSQTITLTKHIPEKCMELHRGLLNSDGWPRFCVVQSR